MSVPVQTPEILQILNNIIVNVVTLIETFLPYIMGIAMVFFCAWLMWQIAWLFHDIITGE